MKSSNSTKLQPLETGYILKIDQVKWGAQPIYLIQSYYKGEWLADKMNGKGIYANSEV